MKNDLNFGKVCARWVPCQLTETHKKNRMVAALNSLEQYSNEGEDMLNRIVTGDET